MQKTIWIIDHYASEPQYGGISRQYDFTKQLCENGYRVVVVSSAFSHFTHAYISNEKCFIHEVCKNGYFVYLHTSEYMNREGIGRARNMLSFMQAVRRNYIAIAKKLAKPDVVVGCSIHPLTWIAANRVAKTYKVKFCAEVRDFWPRMWVVGGMKSRYSPMAVFFGLVQKWAFRKADRIIYSMEHGEKYICDELGYSRDKAFLISQPMDCLRYDENREKVDQLPDNIQEFLKGEFVCSFAGYYMTYEGVYVMLEAAKILKERGIPAKLIFVGSGEEYEGMIEYAQSNDLNNVQINQRIPKETVPALLSQSDVCLAHLEIKGHPEVYQCGVSKNKIVEYLYSGACTLYGFLYKDDAVAVSGGGMVFEPYNAEELAHDIEKVYRMNADERAQFGFNGREFVKNNNSVEVLTDKLLKVLFE